MADIINIIDYFINYQAYFNIIFKIKVNASSLIDLFCLKILNFFFFFRKFSTGGRKLENGPYHFIFFLNIKIYQTV